MGQKTPRLRWYRIQWSTLFCNFKRGLTLKAQNKQKAQKLVADRYPAKKYTVTALKTA